MAWNNVTVAAVATAATKYVAGMPPEAMITPAIAGEIIVPMSVVRATKAPAAAILLRGNNVGIKAIKAELLTPPAKPSTAAAT